MKKKLRDEIKQGKPFLGPEHEAFLNVLRTAALLDHEIAEMLKPYGITLTQLNVLRILRGAGEKGLCRNEVRDRLLTQVPDTTRLLDRMAQMDLLTRVRDEDDRRRVTTRITRRGLDLLRKLDAPLAAQHLRQLGHMSERELRTFIRLLEQARHRE